MIDAILWFAQVVGFLVLSGMSATCVQDREYGWGTWWALLAIGVASL